MENSNGIEEAFSSAGFKCKKLPCDGDMNDIVGWIKQITNPFCFGLNLDDAIEDEVPYGRVLNYCPVSWKLFKQLVPGKDDYDSTMHKNISLTKSSEKFSADPEAYLPQEELDGTTSNHNTNSGTLRRRKENIIEELRSKLNLDVLDVKSSAEYQTILAEIQDRMKN